MASPNAPPGPSSSSSSSSAPQQQQQQQLYHNNTNPFIHNVALGVTPIALLALFLPPRRLDLRALILGGVTLWGTNQLVYDYSGTSSVQRFNQRVKALSGTELPEKAQQMQARLRAEKAERERRRRLQEEASAGGLLSEEQRRRRGTGTEGQKGERGLLEKVWMGDSGDDWKEKRDRREKEALSDGGGGYWGLIVDQVSEVWNGKKADDKEGDKGSAVNETKRS
ncbi:hypothetical protein M434DRAFT_394328 [Hypoxylon sp. CO27-5]|nr:hypothetical protein M434DRAFT_394328 [Hypoxylon sp. CO27-5]